MSIPRLWLYQSQGILRDGHGKAHPVSIERTPDSSRELPDGPGAGDPILERGRRVVVLDKSIDAAGEEVFVVEGFVLADSADAPIVRRLQERVAKEAARRLKGGIFRKGQTYRVEVR